MSKSNDWAAAENPSALGLKSAGAVIAATLLVNGLIGQRFSPSPDHPATRRWYRRLAKPAFTPPGPAFAIGWTLIEAALSYGGYRLMRQKASSARNRSLALWGLNTAMIGGWSILFFGRKDLRLSAVAAAGMMGTAAAYAVSSAKTDRVAAVTALPLIGWLGFAATLAEEVWRRNDAA